MRRRSLTPVVVLALATCAWLHARGFAALVGGRLAVPELHVVSVAQAAAEPPAPRSADPILARNPFDSVTGPLLGGPEASDPAAETQVVAPCDDVRVVSIVAFADPEWSFAMLDVRGEHEPLLRRRGDLVAEIAVDRVLVDRSGRRCVARIFSPPSTTAPPPSASGGARGIVRTGPGSFVLDRSARDALIEGGADLTKYAAVRAEKNGDDVIGLKITALKPGTALDALGVRAGDVLESLDGIPLTAPDRMLQAYARARAEEHVRIVLLRDGHEQQIDYEVR
jgi:general secretion pathway protein C